MSLQGKNAVVPGGSRGIGARIALALAQDGANVLINFTSDSSKDAANEIVSNIKALGRKAFAVQADQAQEDIGIKLVAGAKEAFGTETIHILVHNAAVSELLPLDKVTPAHFHRLMTLNVLGPILITQAFLPHIARGGKIILIGSTTGRMGNSFTSVYGATKASVEHLARCWASEFGNERDIKVNSLLVGGTNTDMAKSGLASMTPEMMAKLQGEIGASKYTLGQPEDIADIVRFLASDGSRWIQGSTVSANGGMVFV